MNNARTKFADIAHALADASSWVSAVSTVFLLLAPAAYAEVRVSGTKAAVTVDATNASVQEIIAALNATLKVEITATPLAGAPMTGTYSGTLRRVLSRMFDNNDFILSSSGDRINIILASRTASAGGTRAIPVSAPTPVGNNNVGNVEEEPHTPGVAGWAGGFTIQK